MSISREIFEAWRVPRFGTANPTRHDNELWAALVHERISAWQVDKRFGYERARGERPTWCFDRLGQTATQLDDGSTLYIGGEHEDYYDPDFYIYNDVVITAADGAVAIRGYPRDVFPPTDFHSATRVGDHIWIVGSLGYAGERHHGATQVCRLDLRTFTIELLATTGESPGWIHSHDATLDGRSILVSGGLVEYAEWPALDENIDDWALDLGSLLWTRRTARAWQRWAARRSDGERSYLWELRQMKWRTDHPQLERGSYDDDTRKALGGDPDLTVLATLYAAPGATVLEQREDDDHNLFRIELEGIVVRIKEETRRIAVIVEGRLAERTLRALQDHVLAALGQLHFHAWELER